MIKLFKVATAVEVLGTVICAIGIGIEVAMGEEVGLMLITAGSVLVACGSILFTKVSKLWRG